MFSKCFHRNHFSFRCISNGSESSADRTSASGAARLGHPTPFRDHPHTIWHSPSIPRGFVPSFWLRETSLQLHHLATPFHSTSPPPILWPTQLFTKGQWWSNRSTFATARPSLSFCMLLFALCLVFVCFFQQQTGNTYFVFSVIICLFNGLFIATARPSVALYPSLQLESSRGGSLFCSDAQQRKFLRSLSHSRALRPSHLTIGGGCARARPTEPTQHPLHANRSSMGAPLCGDTPKRAVRPWSPTPNGRDTDRNPAGKPEAPHEGQIRSIWQHVTPNAGRAPILNSGHQGL